MSADLLREAADAIRADNQPCDDTFCVEARFMWAVADLLTYHAGRAEAWHHGEVPEGHPALAVARAYLGESA